VTTTPAPQRAWLVVLGIYAITRGVSSLLLGTMFAIASKAGWTFASHRVHPTFFTFSGSWDSSAYKTIAEHGYPTTLPTDAAGHVLPNPWAFLPVFPGIERAVAALTGLEFYTAGVIIATVFGFGASLMLYLLLRLRVDETPARWAVVFFGIGPLGFILQAAYAESAFLFFLFAGLWALMTRRYLLVMPFGVLAAFTRPGVLALAVAMAVHLVLRWRERGMPGRTFSFRHRFTLVAVGLVVAAAGLAWPVVASRVTGVSNAYLDTELSFWVGFVGRRPFTPFTPWFVMASRYLGVAGVVLVVVVLAAGVFWLSRKRMRMLGPELLGFSAAYWLYLVAVFLPQQSLPRLLLPTAMMLADPALSATRRRRFVLAGAGVVLQAVAVVFVWFLGYP